MIFKENLKGIALLISEDEYFQKTSVECTRLGRYCYKFAILLLQPEIIHFFSPEKIFRGVGGSASIQDFIP